MTCVRDSALAGLVPVERLLRGAAPTDIPDLLETRVVLEAIAGNTVTRGRAGRFLGITQTSVDRWIKEGAIPTVIDPSGRVMVPTREAVRLRVEVEEAREAGSRRPLGRAVRRRREAAAAVPVRDLLTDLDGPLAGHRQAEVADLLMHRLIARALTARDIEVARWQLERSHATGDLHPYWHAAWREILAGGEERVLEVLTEDSPEAASLRQTSPFKGLLGHEERRRAVEVLRLHVR